MTYHNQVRILSLVITLNLFLNGSIYGAESESDNAVPLEKHKCCHRPSEQYDVHRWFHDYDSIRKHAKMSLKEKMQSRHLLILAINPMALFSDETAPLLHKMIGKYSQAIEDLEKLPRLEQTAELQSGYLEYFSQARQLFIDICAAQEDAPIQRHKLMPALIQRRRDLEGLDQKNKELDASLRRQYEIPPMRG